MKVTPDPVLPEVLLIEPTVHADHRGFFFESHNERAFDDAAGRRVRFVQDNHSHSVRGVVRGLHYQIAHTQAKLVRVVRGAAFDVAVDLRRSSPTFGRWVGYELSETNRRQLWVPEGFGHGYAALEDVDFLYKTTDYWNKSAERCVVWNDPTLAIDWRLGGRAPIVSDADAKAPRLDAADVFD